MARPRQCSSRTRSSAASGRRSKTGFNPSTLPPVAQNSVPPPVGLFGVFRRHRYEEEQQQNAEQQQAYANGRASYSRAMNVCLTGRGYTVD